MISSYFIHLLTLIGIYTVLSLSLQLSVGFSGMLNFGHIAFYALGAYISAILAKHGFPFWLCISAAALLPSLLAYPISQATRKLKGDYLALATLGFTLVVYSVATNWDTYTGGPMGLASIPKPQIFGIDLENGINFLALTISLSILTYVLLKLLTISSFGKTLEAVRDDKPAAEALGKDVAKIQNQSLMISAFFAGIAGSLFSYYVTYIDPSTFVFGNLIPVLAMVIVGGLASLEGTIFATIIFVLLPEPLRLLGLPSSVVGPARQILYAISIILILLYKPKGFYGKVNLE